MLSYYQHHNTRPSSDTTSSGDYEPADSSIKFSHINFFHHYVRYSNVWVEESGLEALPGGSSHLTGRVTYQGEPARGVRLFAIINSQYRSPPVTTGDDGYFDIVVPDGKWTVNRIELPEWKEQPETGGLTVTTGLDPALEESMYHSGPGYNSEGLPLQATGTQVLQAGLTLAMHNNPVITSPTKAMQRIDPAAGTINWNPVNSASHYQLQLHETMRDGTTTSYHPTAWFNTDSTSVALSQFKSIDDSDGNDNEYTVRVFAFDDQGKLLSSNDFSFNSSIIINGRKFVSESAIELLGDTAGMPEEDFMRQLEATQRDRRRIEAARTLIKNDMTGAATSLLERVETEKLNKEKSIALGMAMAADGKCEEALNLFTELNMQNGRSCKPDFVTQLCPD